MRRILLIFGLSLILGACATPPSTPGELPAILFVHGNGDTAAVWNTTMWRFESNGWDRRLLHAIDFRNPVARLDDGEPQETRSSSAEQREQLAAKVAEVRRITARDRIVLIGSSRGGYAIRDYVKNGGGAAFVSHVILAGTPNHGTSDWEDTRGSEFNAKGAFLTQLNEGPEEVVPGVRFMTIRSDHNDKYAHPDGRYIGGTGRATNVGYDGPALKGAENVVIPNLDHRETAFHPLAFAAMYRFITGSPPARLDIVPEREVTLNGKVNGMITNVPTNLPVEGATVEVYEVARGTGERMGPPAHRAVTGADGLWGPFRANPEAYYEFVVSVRRHAITHIYRSPFPRSSDVVHLRPADLGSGERNGCVVLMVRPRGYFGVGRDVFLLDGKAPEAPEVTEGVPAVSGAKVVLPADAIRAVPARFNDETIVARSWPGRDGHVSIAEFHY